MTKFQVQPARPRVGSEGPEHDILPSQLEPEEHRCGRGEVKVMGVSRRKWLLTPAGHSWALQQNWLRAGP